MALVGEEGGKGVAMDAERRQVGHPTHRALVGERPELVGVGQVQVVIHIHHRRGKVGGGIQIVHRLHRRRRPQQPAARRERMQVAFPRPARRSGIDVAIGANDRRHEEIAPLYAGPSAPHGIGRRHRHIVGVARIPMRPRPGGAAEVGPVAELRLVDVLIGGIPHGIAGRRRRFRRKLGREPVAPYDQHRHHGQQDAPDHEPTSSSQMNRKAPSTAAQHLRQLSYIGISLQKRKKLYLSEQVGPRGVNLLQPLLLFRG